MVEVVPVIIRIIVGIRGVEGVQSVVDLPAVPHPVTVRGQGIVAGGDGPVHTAVVFHDIVVFAAAHRGRKSPEPGIDQVTVLIQVLQGIVGGGVQPECGLEPVGHAVPVGVRKKRIGSLAVFLHIGEGFVPIDGSVTVDVPAIRLLITITIGKIGGIKEMISAVVPVPSGVPVDLPAVGHAVEIRVIGGGIEERVVVIHLEDLPAIQKPVTIGVLHDRVGVIVVVNIDLGIPVLLVVGEFITVQVHVPPPR